MWSGNVMMVQMMMMMRRRFERSCGWTDLALARVADTSVNTIYRCEYSSNVCSHMHERESECVDV